MADFIMPEFLEDSDVDTIHDRMLDQLPADIDSTEGGFVWDFTRPTALIASELLQYYIPELIKLFFAQWSHGVWLEYLGRVEGVNRKEATSAIVTLTITGEEGTEIEAGTIFTTDDIDDGAVIEFATDTDVVIDENGVATVNATAVEPGSASNVGPGTIINPDESTDEIETVTNEIAAVGGMDEEDDESYRVRVLEAYGKADQSYTGTVGDYKRWAESVVGVGSALVNPAEDGTGLVKITIIDSNGDPASQAVIDAVYNYIMSPDDPLQRLAPPGVTLVVSPPTLVEISYSVTVEVEEEYTEEAIESALIDALDSYYPNCPADGELKYSKVFSMISNLDGVLDHSGLLINGGEANIPIAMDEFPSTASISITIGKV